MALAFVHFSIVVKRESVVRVIRNGSFDDTHLLAVANNLVDGDFGDDYLIGIESMNGNLSDEFLILQRLGLHWNDGKDCMDFFIPSDGATTATWLKYERVKHADIYYSVYAHSDDHSNEIVSANGSLNSSSVSSGVLLDRRHWGTVARDELNRLYRPTLVELLNEASCNGRVCPKPMLWNELHEIAVEADINDSTPPPLPLILGGWFHSENSEKSKRLMELLHWTCQNNVSDVVWAYLKSLSEDDWHHSDNNVPNVVLSVLEETHNRLWGMGANVSSQTSRAQKLTREWQNSLVTNDPIRYKAEFVADNDSGYKIDLVDLKDRIAYELKVSQNNAHFEFYKDVFKILYANKSKKIIDKLVFCCPAAAKSTLGALAIFVTTLSEKLDLEVEIHYIKNTGSNQ